MLLKIHNVYAGYDGGDVLKGINYRGGARHDDLYRRTQWGRQIHGFARAERAAQAATGRDHL